MGKYGQASAPAAKRNVRAEREEMIRRACVDCIFLVRQVFSDGPYAKNPYILDVKQDQRDKSKANDFSWHKDRDSLGCYKGVWDQGANMPRANWFRLLVKQNRRGKCYFYKYDPHLMLPAAADLQASEAIQSKDSEKRRLTVYGIVLSIIGLALALAYNYYSKMKP